MKKTKKITRFRPQIRSKHPSHRPFRSIMPRQSFRSVIRLGSVTDLPDTVSHGGKRIEVNTVQAIKNTSNKEMMKKCFDKAKIKHLEWYIYKKNDDFIDMINSKIISIDYLHFPIIAKHRYHSRGRGLRKLDSKKELMSFISDYKNAGMYHFERYFSGIIEYRIHASPHLDNEIFSIRKLRHQNEDGSFGWIFNSHNGCFVRDFVKPSNWKDIVNESIKAVASLGMDIGAVDIKTNRSGNIFYIIEVNSAPGMGGITSSSYINAFNKILKIKSQNGFI